MKYHGTDRGQAFKLRPLSPDGRFLSGVVTETWFRAFINGVAGCLLTGFSISNLWRLA
jgi:hypothetical protein